MTAAPKMEISDANELGDMTNGPLKPLCRRFGLDHTCLTLVFTQFGFSLIGCIVSFYYVKVFLNVYQISEWWFQLAQLLFMVWNALNDPLFGYFQDVGFFNISWLRNRRLNVLYTAPLMALSFMLFWLPFSDSESASWVVGMHLIIALFLWDGFLSFAGLAYCALFTEVTVDHNERVRLVRYNQMAALIGLNAITFVEKVSSSLQDMSSFRLATLLLMCISICAFLYTGLYAKDSIAQVHSVNSMPKLEDAVSSPTSSPVSSAASCHTHKSPYNSWSDVWCVTKQVLTERNFHYVTWTNFFHIIRTTVHGSFAAIFTEGLIPRDVLPLGSWQISFFYWINSVVPQLCVILFGKVLERLGPWTVFRRLLWFSVGITIIMYFIGRHHPYIIILYIFLESILLFVCSPLFMILFPDLVDDDMVRHRRSAPISSVIFSLNALITKPAQSIGPMVVVAIMGGYGYDEYKKAKPAAKYMSTDEEDWSDLRDCMFGILCGVTIVLAIVEYFVLSRYTLHDRHERSVNFSAVSQSIDAVPLIEPT